VQSSGADKATIQPLVDELLSLKVLPWGDDDDDDDDDDNDYGKD
jgi:hypothetical protein